MERDNIIKVLRLGMTRDQVRLILGDPHAIGIGTRKYPRPRIWKYYDLELNFEYNEDGGLVWIMDEDHNTIMGGLSLKKDGTVYLAKVRFKNNLERWELIHWGKPVAFSDPYQKETWCDQAGFGLKYKDFLIHYPLKDIVNE